MTDRLTDEQVRELWERVQQAITYKRWQRCWDDAYQALSVARPVTGDEWNRVKKLACELLSDRGIDEPCTAPSGNTMTLEEATALLAEVRRARGME